MCTVQKSSKELKITRSEFTGAWSAWALAKDDFPFDTRGEVAIKRFSHPLLAHNLVLEEAPGVETDGF